MTRDLLEAVANPTNQRILGELVVEPGYARQLARLLGIAESEVTRRLRRLEDLGVLESSWEHIGKNVKMYELAVDEVAVDFQADGVAVRVADRDDTVDRTRLTRPASSDLPETDGFVGRDDEMAVLAGDASAVVVTGMAGIGKSQLLARYARRVADERPVLWHRFRGPESLTWLARRVASLCEGDLRARLLEQAAGTEPAERIRSIRQALEAEDVVLVLDDVDRIEDDDVDALVEDLVRDPPPAKVVVAARRRPRHDPSRDDVAVVELSGLDDTAIAEVLASYDHDTDDDLVRRVRDEVGGHPLALHLLLETARSHDGGLEALLDRVPEDDLADYLLAEVHDGMTDAEERVLAVASLFEGRFTADDLGALVDRRVEPVLFNLRRRSLVLAEEDGYRLHETVRHFFSDLLDDPATVHAEIADHLADRDDLEAHLEAMHHWLQAGRPDRVFDRLQDDLDVEEIDYVGAGYQHLYRRVLDALDVDDAPDEHTRALLHDELGDVHMTLGDLETARGHHTEAWDHFEAVGDDERIADLAWKRARACRDLGETDRARKLCRRGLDADVDGQARQRLEELDASLSD